MALAEAGLELEELEAEAMAAPETGKRQLMGPWNPAITHQLRELGSLSPLFTRGMWNNIPWNFAFTR